MKLFDRLFAKPAPEAPEVAALAAALYRLRIVEAQAHEQAGAAYKARSDLNDALAAKMALAEQLANVIHSRDAWRAECLNRNAALDAIGATESRNGTAQRLARLAREARE